MQSLGDSYQSARRIIGKLPSERDNAVLAREIYDDKKRLFGTAASVKLTEELNRLIEYQQVADQHLAEQVEKRDYPVLVEEELK